MRPLGIERPPHPNRIAVALPQVVGAAKNYGAIERAIVVRVDNREGRMAGFKHGR